MKKFIPVFIILLFSFSGKIYPQYGVVSPSLDYLGSIEDEESWNLNCDTWKRTIRGIEGQLPQSTNRIAVQILLDYVEAYGQIGQMKIEVYDVWAIQYPSYIVFVWFTNYDRGTWTFKSMNIMTY